MWNMEASPNNNKIFIKNKHVKTRPICTFFAREKRLGRILCKESEATAKSNENYSGHWHTYSRPSQTEKSS